MDEIEIVERSSKEVIDILLMMKQEKKLCDATIIANGERIKVHALVLAYSSKYFENLFTNSMSPMREVTFENINMEILQLFIDYCYTGNMKISVANAYEVMKMASDLSMPKLIEASSKIVHRILNADTSLSTWKYAQISNIDNLKNAAFDIIKKNFEKVSKTEEFLNMTFSQVRDLLNSGTLDASNLSIYNAIKNWITHDSESRLENSADLLDCIKLECLPDELLFSEPIELCNLKTKCLDAFVKALQKKINMDRTKCTESINITDLSTVIAVGSSDLNQAKIIEVYDLTNKNWIEIKNIPINKMSYSVAFLNDKLMIIGGLSDGSSVNTVENYDFKTGQIESLPVMKYKRSYSSAVQYGGSVYVFGGYSDYPLARVEKWNSILRVWSELPLMTSARYGFGAKELNGDVFLVGGYNRNYLSKTDAFNLITNEWRTCAPMKESRFAPGVEVIGGYLYAIGGITHRHFLNSVERYDPNIDQWTIFQSTELKKSGMGTANLSGKLVIAGGRTSSEILSTVEMYDEQEKKWKPMAQLKNPRDDFFMVEIPWNLVKDVMNQK